MYLVQLQLCCGLKSLLVDNVAAQQRDKVVFDNLHRMMKYERSLKRNFVEVLIIDFTINHDFDNFISLFHNTSDVVVNLIKYPVKIMLRTPDYVIILEDFMQPMKEGPPSFDAFQKVFGPLLKERYMEKSRKFIMINYADELLAKYFNNYFGLSMWQNEIYNVLHIDFLSHNVVKYTKVFKRKGELYKHRSDESDEEFPVKTIYETHENHINVLQYDSPPFSYVENGKIVGLEGMLINEIAHRCNITYNIVNANSTVFLIKNFHQHMKQNVDLNLNNDIKINPGSMFKENFYYNEFDGLCLIAPRNILVSAYENFSFPFDSKITICLLCCTCLVVVLWKCFSMENKSDFSINFIIFAMYRYLMGNAATRENRMGYKEKLIVYGYVIAAMVLLALYESFVISFMLTSPTYRSAKDFAEINDTNTRIYQYFIDSGFPIEFKNHLIVNKLTTKDNNTILTVPSVIDINMAYVASCRYAEAFVKSSRNFHETTQLFDKINEKLTTFPESYFISKSLPIKKDFQFIVTALKEGGIYNLWMNRIFHDLQNHYHLMQQHIGVETKEEIYLKFRDMKIPFIILFTGMTLALIVFLVEKILQICFPF